jgi:hypothetical protein
MQEVVGFCDEFLLQTNRLDDDFLFSINFEGEYLDAREGTIERDDMRLPAGTLAGKIIDAIEAFSDPVGMPATPAPAIMPATPAVVASAPWFADAKPLEQGILSTVDERLAGNKWPCDFTEFIRENSRLFDPRRVQRLAGSLNRILEKAGKPCRFKAPNSAKELILVCINNAQPRTNPGKSKSKRRKNK